MLIVELFIVLAFIFLGTRIGGIGIGLAGGLGVLVLTLGMGLTAGAIPVDVILIIMAVLTTIAAMQVAGGMEYLVSIAEKLLRKHPQRITFLAPVVTYLMTLLAGTGHTAFSTLPVIAQVAKEQGIRPSRPLSIAVIASQIAITASPISAALIFFSGLLEEHQVSYLSLLIITIPSTFLACMVGALVANKLGKELADDEICQQHLQSSKDEHKNANQIVTQRVIPETAKLSVGIFSIAIILVVLYATLVSDSIAIFSPDVLDRNQAIIAIMLSAATAIVLFTKIDANEIANAATFKSGMTACICVLGVAWLGDTFVANHIDEIKTFAGDLLNDKPWLLAVTLFFASMLLYSQGATTIALMPAALSLGVAPVTAIASFAAVSALFVLPTYPTLIAAVEMDETGSTRIGKYVFNHPFFIPGVVTVFFAVLFGSVLGHIVL